MATKIEDIDGGVLGNRRDITRTVADVPSGQLVTKAWFTVKKRVSDADADAVFQKIISASYVPGQGEITDQGAMGTAALLYEVMAADTLDLIANFAYWYDIKVLTDASVPETPFSGHIKWRAAITRATS